MNASLPALIEGEPSGEELLVARTGPVSAMPPIITQYWQMLVRWKKPAIAVLALSLVVALVVTLLMPQEYTARTQVEISREQKQVTNVEGLDSPNAGQDQEFYDTQYALLEARSLAERVSRRLNLARTNELFEAHGIKLNPDEYGAGSGARLTPTQLAKRERLAADLLLKNVGVAAVKKSRLVAVSYTSRSPATSARVANTWVQEYIASTMDRQFASTADARKFLEDRLAGLRTKLEDSERQMVNYASRNKISVLSVQRDPEGRTTTEKTVAASNVETLNQALNAAIADRIAAESRLATGNEAMPEALSNNAIGQLREKRAELAGKYANLMANFTPDYPEAQALQKEIAALDASIERETGRFSGSRQAGYREALKREQQLRAKLEQQVGLLDNQQRASIQYNIYQRDVDTNRQLYEALLQRYKEIGVAGSVGINNIAIIDQAEVPTSASSPSLTKNLAIGFVIGLLLAVGVALALEHMDEGIRLPSDVPRQLDLPLLGYVPVQEQDTLEAIADIKSTLIESYFSIRSNLAFTTAHGVPRSLMVTSTRPAEGKSVSSLGLAVVIGLTGKRVLLIDADMRSPSAHEYAGVENDKGLSNLLSGSDDFRSMVVPTRYRGVSVLPAGPHPPSAAELLSNDRLRRISADLLAEYDHIIFDTPPVLGLTDAPLLARAVEGCVYVIEADGVPVRGIREALNRLRQADSRIFGVVLTKVETAQAGYGYGYGYGYEYGKSADEGRTV
jgi:capsular exopolysaccharide synthesis family protein